MIRSWVLMFFEEVSFNLRRLCLPLCSLFWQKIQRSVVIAIASRYHRCSLGFFAGVDTHTCVFFLVMFYAFMIFLS